MNIDEDDIHTHAILVKNTETEEFITIINTHIYYKFLDFFFR